MARINPITSNHHSTAVTNTQKTLAHSLQAFEVYIQLYSLFEKVKEVAGKRTAALFAWSVSTASDSALCTSFFRKIIVEGGENPEEISLNDHEKVLLDFGSALSQHKGRIADHIYNSLAQYHNEEEMVLLIAFAGQLIATNIFNNAVETEIDGSLSQYLPAKYYV
jgi:diacylglycerol kinase